MSGATSPPLSPIPPAALSREVCEPLFGISNLTRMSQTSIQVLGDSCRCDVDPQFVTVESAVGKREACRGSHDRTYH